MEEKEMIKIVDKVLKRLLIKFYLEHNIVFFSDNRPFNWFEGAFFDQYFFKDYHVND
jgi:hypothetical protein